MMAIEDFDLQFLDSNMILQDHNDSGDRFDPESLIFGNDPSLSSVLNLDDGIQFDTPTDSMKLTTDQVGGDISQAQSNNKLSPWHESDSGMSESTAGSESPCNFLQEFDEQPVAVSATNDSHSQSEQTNDTEFINIDVEELEEDELEFAFEKPASGSLPMVLTLKPCKQIHPVDLKRKQRKDALEFFSSDLFSPSTSKSKSKPTVHFDNSIEVGSKECNRKPAGDKCNKNAIQAKVNREKKKAYVKSLEEEIKSLREDNENLKAENSEMKDRVGGLEDEAQYLKSVLVNSSSLSSLLKNITEVKEVNLSATVLARGSLANAKSSDSRKRSFEDDHSYNYNLTENPKQKRARLISENLRKAGVCLHVDGKSASLEFCSHCSRSSQRSNAF